jgi:predicted aconitase with swiveling domain
MNARVIAARGIVEGRASGKALMSREAISFLGDVDIRSGRVVGQLPSVAGRALGGSVLVMPFTRGSAGAWRFVYQLYKHGVAPVAMITGTVPDPSVVQGAILAGIPIACEPEEALDGLIADGALVTVTVEGESARIEIA